jgi:RimJ/RimL family protein N-acetyltransferase
MTFKEKMAWLRSNIFYGRTIEIHPYGMEYVDDIIRIRNQPEVKYYLLQDHDITREEQIAWIKKYEARDDEAGLIIKNKRGEVIGINFFLDYDPATNSMDYGRGTFDLAKIMGMPYALDTFTVLMDLYFDTLKFDLLRTSVKMDNHRLLKFYKKMNWDFVHTHTIKGHEYQYLELRAGQSKHKVYAHLIEHRENKVTG